MNYDDQWIAVTIKPINFDLTIARARIFRGKFYEDKDNTIEIDWSAIEGQTIAAGASKTIYSWDMHVLNGALYLAEKRAIIGIYSWVSNNGSGIGSRFQPGNLNYEVAIEEDSLMRHFALGDVTLKVTKK